MSVDMSSAFDTIDRQNILNVPSDAGCTEDETRLARLLLTNHPENQRQCYTLN